MEIGINAKLISKGGEYDPQRVRGDPGPIRSGALPTFLLYLRAGDVTRTTPQNSGLFVIAVLLQM